MQSDDVYCLQVITESMLKGEDLVHKMAGFDSLPFEIHQQILLYFRPPEKTERHPLSHFGSFMSVCKQWRDVIVQTRLFWTTVHIKYHPTTRFWIKGEFEEFIPHLEVLVERSKDAPLDVSMNLSGLVEKECTALLHFFQKSAKLSQWKTLEVQEFRSIQPVDPELLQVIPFQEFSGLKYLSLGEVRSFPFLEWLDSTGTQVSGLSVAVQYSDVNLPNLLDTFPRILDQITELELKEVTYEDTENISIELPRNIVKLISSTLPRNISGAFLTHLSVEQMYVSASLLNQSLFPRLERFDAEQLEPWHNDIIWLSSVKHFETSNYQLSPLLHFDFPSLETLRIKEAIYSKEYATVKELFTRFRLTPDVVILDLPMSLHEIRTILRVTPDLRELRIQLYEEYFGGHCLCGIFLPYGHPTPRGESRSSLTSFSNNNSPPL
ncbi:hypothetical protein CPB86DRAFT_878519 [Serendipita vermifera]|nr:hypothetical protein CPB86DRAFT_878519 [Serendipita vermifera]